MARYSSMRVGQIHTTNNFGKLKIVEYISKSNIKVKFLDTGTIMQVRASAIASGEVKDPNAPNVYGVGYIGQGKFSTKDILLYKLWKNMLGRCYDTKIHTYFPTYGECEVDRPWHDFQRFCADVALMIGYEKLMKTGV